MKEKPPLREVLWGAVKHSSPRHAEKRCIFPIVGEQGRYFFHSGSLEVAVAAVECLDAADAPMPRASARLRPRWAVAGPGRASRRRAERSSRRGRLAGGPPPTGTPSSPAPQPGPPAPETPVGPKRRRNTSGATSKTRNVDTANSKGPEAP